MGHPSYPPLRFFKYRPRSAVLTFAPTLRMAELMLDYPRVSAKRNFPRLVLLAIRLVAFNVKCTATIVELVLDCLIESSFHI